MTAVNWKRGDILVADDLDGAFGRCIDRAGDTMSGLLTLAQDPVNMLDAVTKRYVDNLMSPTGPYILKAGDTMAGTLGFATTANGGNPLLGGTFIGDHNKLWFTGALFGFGQAPNSTSGANNTGPVLTAQRNPTYTGAMAGNPSAFTVFNTVGANVTGLENCFISQLTINATAGIYTSGTVTAFKAAAGSSLITLNVNSQDRSGSKSSVSGSNVPCEFDLWGSGPDDAGLRVGVDMIMGEYQPSSDGATTFTCAGMRTRGREYRVAQSGATSVPTSAIVGNKVTTVSELGGGLTGSFGSGYLVDGATTAAFNASSATQTRQTNTSFAGGVTTLTLVASSTTPSYVWPGSLVTGTNIAANTHVLTQSWDGNVTTTITIDTPTAGAIANNANLTFTNAIAVGLLIAGYLTSAAIQSPGFSVGPAGVVNTTQNYGVSGTKVIGARDTGWTAMTGTSDKATAFATSTVTLAQLAGRVMALQAALTTHGLIGT